MSTDWGQVQASRVLHWFLFGWVGLVSLWGLAHLLMPDVAAYKCWYNSVSPETCPPLTVLLSSMHPEQVGAFTLLMLGYGLPLWVALAGRIPQRWHWLPFLLQAGCVLLSSLVVRQDNVVLSLYLVLILEAIGMRAMTRFALLVATSSLLLFVFNELLSRGALNSWTAAGLSIWISTDYAALGLFLVGYLILYFQLSGAHRQLASTYGELEEAHTGLATAASQIERLTLLTERQRLARDLHDTLSQGLVGVKLQLEAVDALLGDHGYEQAQEVVKQAMTRVQETLLEARSVIDELRASSATAHNCTEAAEVVIRRFTTATGIPCQTDLTALTSLPVALHEHVLRVLGEGLANIAQHAQARQVWVRASQEGDLLSIEVCDDGRGFEPTSATAPAGHYGLLGLRERARLVGGRVEIASAPGAGTSLRFWLPSQVGAGWAEAGTTSSSSLTRGATA